MLTPVCLVEEASAEEMLKQLLPRLLTLDIRIQYIVFEGKSDMNKQIERKIKLFQIPNSVFLMMQDQNSGDCRTIKDSLQKKINLTGKSNHTLIRIACRELETFYLGDLQAVGNAMSLPKLSRLQNNRKYRNPDSLTNAAREMQKITKGCYSKKSGSRKIAACLSHDKTNRSVSFNVLLDGIGKLIAEFKDREKL